MYDAAKQLPYVCFDRVTQGLTVPHAFLGRLSGQFGPQQFIFCWPAGPVTFISVVNMYNTFFRWSILCKTGDRVRNKKPAFPQLDTMNSPNWHG